ncbi:hypothetical protein Tco_1469471 [Tanacetum coccineum]
MYSSDSALWRTFSGKVAGPAAKLKTRSWAVDEVGGVMVAWAHAMERGLVLAREIGRVLGVVAREGVKVIGFFKRKVFGVVAAEVAMAVGFGVLETLCQGRNGGHRAFYEDI